MYDVLIQRMIRIEKALARAEERANQLQKEIDHLYVERNNSFRVHEVQYNRTAAVIERLTLLEDKVVPGFGRTLHQMEDLVGDLDQWHANNPLDRREKKP